MSESHLLSQKSVASATMTEGLSLKIGMNDEGRCQEFEKMTKKNKKKQL